LKLKKGVIVSGVKPEMIVALMIAQAIYAKHGIKFVVTSICDGKHSRRSRHYSGYALDFRIWGMNAAMKTRVTRELQTGLGPEYFVLLEKDHIHIGFRGAER